MQTRLGQLLVAALLTLVAAPTLSATVAGRVTRPDGTGLSGIEVRLWSAGGKGWRVVSTAPTDAGGAYSFVDVAEGSYRLDARLPFLVEGFLADRWFDAAPPLAEGWDGYSADVLVLSADTSMSALDIVLPLHGGLDGTITRETRPGDSLWVRADSRGRPGVHHNVQTNEQGRYSFRGLIPAADYRIFVFDPNARMQPQLFAGPFDVQSSATTDGGTLALAPHAPDPYEPNDGPGGSAYTIDAERFRGEVPDAFITESAYIGPRGADIDYYCFEARQRDRFLAYTITDLGIPGEVLDNPWVDPMLRFVTPGGRVIDESDDAPGFGLNAAVDTGDVTENGTICVVVTMYGDSEWVGANHQSGGEYTLIVELGNRVPQVALKIAESAAPTPPGQVIVSEGQLLRIDVEATDPENDPLDGWVSHVEADGDVVSDGEFTMTPEGRGTYAWTVPDDGARHAPYEITITVSDGEFNVNRVVLVSPRTVNLAPNAPEPISPANGASVPSWTPTLEVRNAVDPDGDLLTYEFEVHYGDPSEAPDEIGRVAEDPDGTTSWTMSEVEENQRITWRARASDGALTGGTSAWSPFQTFVVNVDNETPTTPVLVKPDEGATVPQRTPTLSAENTEDADGDTQFMVFEVSTDATFATIDRTSEPVEQNTITGRTGWAVDPPLDWGVTYFARAYATDPQGAKSPYSNVRQFRVKNNSAPERPELGGVFAEQCSGLVLADGPPAEFVVLPVSDAEGEPLLIDFRIYEYPGDLEAGTPVYQETIEQPAQGEEPHVVVPDPALFTAGSRYAVYARSDDGDRVSDWKLCDFWVLGDNEPPGPLEFLEPAAGAVLPEDSTQVAVRVRNAVDPNGADTLAIAWCAANLDADTGCPEDATLWNRVAQAEGEETDFVIEGVFPGARIGLQSRAIDQIGAMGPVASVAFEIDKSKTTVTPSLCACGVTPGRSDAGGMLVIAAVALFAMRRRGP